MNSVYIRQQFLDFFASKSHKIVPSAPIIVKDDPTLMFTNAGMNQFKDIFLGNKIASFTRVADTQKCLRVSGKHNDLEEVGKDTYHHTMFEMLGNWSFGDYFKEEAISWAWELLTEVYKIDKEKLYVTVFGGDINDGLEADDEAAAIWAKYIDPSRILRFGRKDNFWEMGEQGPCGPCSEIHVDIRTDEEKESTPGKELVNTGHPHVIEIWNNVFIQFNRVADGTLKELPAKHVDTGMGFERLCMVLQGKRSNYDTDVFQPLIQTVSAVSGVQYGIDERTDIAMRVIADHIRAVAFTIADGQLPSNTGAGYVIRRILRRAIRYGYSALQLNNPFMHALIQPLEKQMGPFFPELTAQKGFVQKVILEEEESFLRTLQQGIKRIDQLILSASGGKISGEQVFELYDTYGFPADLTRLILEEHKLDMDEEAFHIELAKQRKRSKADAEVKLDDWVDVIEDRQTEFIGYDYAESKVRITRYRKVEQKGSTFFQLILNLTPFYPEGGGQVGDRGWLINGETIEILDTKKENNLIYHIVNRLPQRIDGEFTAKIDVHKRKASAINHTATHLLHQALREVLGTHVEQRGSLVNAEYLRFDFTHFSRVSEEELARVESLINQRIQENFPLDERRDVPFAEAKSLGAMALFGEKYGDTVRVIRFGESVEFCGGTHVKATGIIGVCKIISEGSVAAGIRRIEAITGSNAKAYFDEQSKKLASIAAMLGNKQDILKSIKALIDENERLKKQLEQIREGQLNEVKKSLQSSITVRGDYNILITQADGLSLDEIKTLLHQLSIDTFNLIAAIASIKDEKPFVGLAISKQALNTLHLDAVAIIKKAGIPIQGGGGGHPFLATAGGKKPSGLPEALEIIRESIFTTL